MDEAWYEGCVNSFDKVSGKHLVEYDDGEEEMIDLSKEKIEWIEVEGGSCVKKSRKRRLRKVSIVVDDEEEKEGEGNVGPVEDDSSDEDWGKNVVGGSEAKKNSKEGDGEAANSSKKKKVEVCVFGSKPVKPVAKVQEAKSHNVLDSTTTDASERFGIREEQKFPFLGKDRQDAKRRRPGDTDYDPRTLYLPPQFLKNLTGGQRQWWEFKSKHMDKVLFFKGEQPHCGFPEKNFSINVEKLARKGYRVLVVEQTETPDQLDMRRKEEGSKDKVVKREICAVVTKGTLTEGEMLSANPDASYIMSVNESCLVSSNKEERLYGVCVVDVTTSQVIIGQIKDDLESSTLCSLLSELRPVEIIKPAKMLSPETERALTRYTRNPLINELLPNAEFWDAERTVREVQHFYSRINISPVPSQQKEATDATSSNIKDESCWLPKLISELLSAGSDGSLALSALGGILYYLKQAFLDENLLRYAKFESLPCTDYCNVFKKPYMVLDAAALENLEIFENSKNGGSSGTLYSQLNYCVTGFGKRLLKTWLARPLYHAESIRERQDAIAGLRENISLALEFRKELSKLPDMERLLTRLFASSEANGRNASKIVLYEDAAKKQLQEFISALRACEVMIVACSSLGSILDNTDSKLLHHLLVPGKGLPNMSSIIKQFRDAFDWVDANSTGRIIPLEGADAEFDSASIKIEEIESDLKRHIVEQKKLLGISSITYVTIGKDIYLLEVPERLSGSVPKDYELRSSKKGFSRYWTPFIKKMVGELTQLQAVKESKLKCMLQDLVGHFCEHHTMWRSLVAAVAELDVLITLVIASDYYEGPTCRPSISTGINTTEVPQLAAKSLGHPIIKSDSLGRGTFVPNDINIGGSDHATFILLTGPNMGGKSTLLRQICLAVILAQVGANVPAEHFELSLVDRIFVRMGAKDHIMAGQSTFLTELSETASMLTSATRDSLVALDELGRGTSTSDGQAIAESVLEHFVRKVQCRGMFSTHYHRLAIDYKRDPKVSLCHMGCQVGKGDRGLEEVTFLYRLTQGACPKSYGVNVARLAGIPDGVLFKAAAKSKEFEAVYGRHQKRSNNSVPDWNEKTIKFFQNLISISSSDDSSNSSIATLSQLQHQARILLEQN
uniref:DNA mismatch repair protein n=1 Tax=Chenopodium quinoa TaxID=63459 RepID=A0A803M7J7_CHEQI